MYYIVKGKEYYDGNTWDTDAAYAKLYDNLADAVNIVRILNIDCTIGYIP